MNVFGKILSDFVTAREAHLCGERGSPAVSKGIVSLLVGYARKAGAVAAPQATMGGVPRTGSARRTCVNGQSVTNGRL